MTKIRLSDALKKSQGGFSLIELAIVMVIIGLLFVPLMQSYNIYQQQKKKGDTLINFDNVDSALSEFYSENGRYPCPADRSIAFGQPGHGEERCTQILALGPNSCGAGGGICRAQLTGDNIQIGGVPYVQLGLPWAETLDGWKNGMKYVVTEVLTSAATFDPDEGAVQIVDENNIQVGNLVHGMVMSLGENGAGSFNTGGVLRPCIGNLIEQENCDEDGVFMQNLDISLGDNNNYFDDYLFPKDWSVSSIWKYSALNQDDVLNTNPGNIGIGTQTPQTKLDVSGDIKANNVRGTNICSEDGTDCFPAEKIGGTGMVCTNGRVLVGIANGEPICENITMPTVAGTCPAGQFATGISAGGVTCAAP